jgi:hypothetical protein
MKNIFDLWIDRAKARKKTVLSIPGILKYKTLLYIGANPSRLELLDLFYNAGYKIDILEIYPPNVEGLRKLNEKEKLFRDIYQGDVREIDGIIVGKKYDVVCFWHGPEHLEKRDIKSTLIQLENKAKNIIFTGCPYGYYPQDDVYGNPAEIHRCSLDVKFFERLGYKTKTIRKKNKRGSNITAWKIKK